MPIDGHPPALSEQFLNLCSPCQADTHDPCGPIWQARQRRVIYCECQGFGRNGEPLPCIRPLLPES